MRSWDAWLSSLAACLLACSGLTEAASRVNDARKLYNQELYELAIRAATEARQAGDAVDEASLIFAPRPSRTLPPDPRRAQPQRGAVRRCAPSMPRSCRRGRRRSSHSPWANTCFWPTSSVRPAELFDSTSARVDDLGPAARDRVLDWWATAMDREAQEDSAHRAGLYQRIIERMEDELRQQPGSTAAGYWLAGRRAIAWRHGPCVACRTGRVPARAGGARTTAPRCAPTSIASSPRPSFPSVPAG
jgi:hypothetical protein